MNNQPKLLAMIGVLCFLVLPASAMAQGPHLKSPTDEATDISLPVHLVWEAFNDAQKYELMVDDKANFGNAIIKLETEELEYFALELEPDSKYFWRVRAWYLPDIGDDPEWSDWSYIWSFTTGLPSDVPGGLSSAPHIYSLSQNHPNPFNPKTTISFSLARTELVTIAIYNILGQKIETLMSETKSAGNWTVEWNGTNAASGIYFYRITAGEFTDTRKMTLLK